jgi:hypothetical protein
MAHRRPVHEQKEPHWDTTLDAFLDGEGIRGAVKTEAVSG